MVKCDICQENDAVYVCVRCGRRVCKDDYVDEEGICKICLITRCEICKKQPAINYCQICGRIGCEDCLIQVSPVTYVCKDCLRKR